MHLVVLIENSDNEIIHTVTLPKEINRRLIDADADPILYTGKINLSTTHCIGGYPKPRGGPGRQLIIDFESVAGDIVHSITIPADISEQVLRGHFTGNINLCILEDLGRF